MFKPGFRFSVRQPSRTSKPRLYTIVFELDNECRPIRVGGVKPTFDTMEKVNRIVQRRLFPNGDGKPVKSKVPQTDVKEWVSANSQTR